MYLASFLFLLRRFVVFWVATGLNKLTTGDKRIQTRVQLRVGAHDFPKIFPEDIFLGDGLLLALFSLRHVHFSFATCVFCMQTLQSQLPELLARLN